MLNDLSASFLLAVSFLKIEVAALILLAATIVLWLFSEKISKALLNKQFPRLNIDEEKFEEKLASRTMIVKIIAVLLCVVAFVIVAISFGI